MKLLVDKIRELCHAESSGISRLQSYGGEEVFRWVAVAAPPLTSGAAGQGRTASQKGPGTGTGTVEQRGTKAANQSAPVRKLAKQKAYTGNSGSKQDPGTVCSTARPTPNGGVDCGTSGDSATLGKIVTKSH
jgi:hypothetical protein